MNRTIVYIDGFNLYFGLMAARLNNCRWLNVALMAQRLLKDEQQLARVKYFTSRVSTPAAKQRRQSAYLEALSTTGIEIFFGHYLFSAVTCRNCNHQFRQASEKMTDVNIAVEITCDAFCDRFDSAILVSADSDLVPAVRSVLRQFPQKRIVVAFPPERVSAQLKNECSAYFHIGREKLRQSQLPERVIKPDGFQIVRPAEWS